MKCFIDFSPHMRYNKTQSSYQLEMNIEKEINNGQNNYSSNTGERK